MSQPVWIDVCPHCQTENEVERTRVTIECGQANADCTCRNCGDQFPAQCDLLQ